MSKMDAKRQDAIVVSNVSKYFSASKGQRSIKQAITSVFSKKKSDSKKGDFQTLKNISFTVKKGEFFGIVGRNGSGKSTLLKMIAGVYSPTAGHIEVNGKLVPFIELGVGFNPELTGRDNVYLNGAMLGFSRKEMTEMYDEIVDFAELGEHMDVKLKNFSSGMQVRLAFSIAIRAESDILLIDEVLAVGDAAFQQKCYEYFARIKRSNKTVILVTHDMSTVERFCTRALIIDKGTNSGEVMSVARAVKLYNEVNQEESASSDIESEQVSHETRQKRVVSVRSVRLLNSDQSEKKSFEQGESMTIEIALQHHSNAVMSAGVVVGLAFHDTDNVNLAGPNSIGHNFSGTEKLIKYKIPKLPFNTGKYSLTVALFDGYLSERYDLIDKNIHFTVIAGTTTYGKFVIDADWSNK